MDSQGQTPRVHPTVLLKAASAAERHATSKTFSAVERAADTAETAGDAKTILVSNVPGGQSAQTTFLHVPVFSWFLELLAWATVFGAVVMLARDSHRVNISEMAWLWCGCVPLFFGLGLFNAVQWAFMACDPRVSWAITAARMSPESAAHWMQELVQEPCTMKWKLTETEWVGEDYFTRVREEEELALGSITDATQLPLPLDCRIPALHVKMVVEARPANLESEEAWERLHEQLVGRMKDHPQAKMESEITVKSKDTHSVVVCRGAGGFLMQRWVMWLMVVFSCGQLWRLLVVERVAQEVEVKLVKVYDVGGKKEV